MYWKGTNKLYTLFLVLLVIQNSLSEDQTFVNSQNGFFYGSNAAVCYSTCKRGQFCTVKAGQAFCKPLCGDGIVVGTQACDDGNQIPGDGCNKCVIQRLFDCKVLPGPSQASVCSLTCINGAYQPKFGEECDDGNTDLLDGCTKICKVTPGFSCTKLQGQLSVCTNICGDGRIVKGQQCDDNNTIAGDGCSDTCQKQNPFICTGTPSKCINVCGNGVFNIKANQQCDNGKSAVQDGCTDDCKRIDGWNCVNNDLQRSICKTICGDGILKGAQAKLGGCDDGNKDADDGCLNNCVVASGWTCTGQPSECKPICGDGKLVGYQTTARNCDDSNTRLGDGCQNCKISQLFSCTGAPSVCVNLCGNKRWNPTVGEDCDNGNPTDPTVDDGCSDKCKWNEGWICDGKQFALSICTPVCGDGKTKGAETCDDKNLDDGDGCSAKCTVQAGYNCSAKKLDGSSLCVKQV